MRAIDTHGDSHTLTPAQAAAWLAGELVVIDLENDCGQRTLVPLAGCRGGVVESDWDYEAEAAADDWSDAT